MKINLFRHKKNTYYYCLAFPNRLYPFIACPKFTASHGELHSFAKTIHLFTVDLTNFQIFNSGHRCVVSLLRVHCTCSTTSLAFTVHRGPAEALRRWGRCGGTGTLDGRRHGVAGGKLTIIMPLRYRRSTCQTRIPRLKRNSTVAFPEAKTIYKAISL